MRSNRRQPRTIGEALARAAAAIAILGTLILAPRTAYADPPPNPQPSPSTPAPSRPIPGPRGPILPPGQIPAPAPPEAPLPGAPLPGAEKPKSNHLLDAILGKQGKLPGEYPLSHYDIGYSSGGFLGSFHPSAILGWLTDIVFTAARWLAAFAIWAINYALTFGIARFLTGPAADVAAGYQSAVQRIGLGWVFLVLAVAYAGWHALRGRLAHGLSEALVSFLVATLLAGLLAAPATTLLGKNGLLDRTSDISLALAGITLNPEHPDKRGSDASTKVSAPMLAKLQHTLVGIPHQVLNWGEVLEGPGVRPQCVKTYRKLLDEGPWGDADKPREEMTAAGCTEQVEFNKRGTADRLIAAVLVLLAVLLACALLALMAFTVVGAQIILALLACFTPLALAAGLLPGAGRQVLWRWASAVLRALAGVVMTVAALSVVIALATAILRADADMPLAVRMGLLDVFMVIAFIFRRRLLEAGRRTAAGIGHRLESVRIGGAHGRGMMPAGSAVAAAESWGQHHQRSLGVRARRELRQFAHARHSDRRLAHTLHDATAPDQPQPQPSRIAPSRTGRAVRLTGKAAGIALAATVGSPVYLPRAARAAKTASKAKTAAVRARLATAKRTAAAFSREYAHNVSAPVRLAASAAQRTSKRPNTPPNRQHHQEGRTPPSHPPGRRIPGNPSDRTPPPPRPGPRQADHPRRNKGPNAETDGVIPGTRPKDKATEQPPTRTPLDQEKPHPRPSTRNRRAAEEPEPREQPRKSHPSKRNTRRRSSPPRDDAGGQ